MDTQHSDKLITRIQNLFAKADGTQYPEEADAFRKKAEALIEQHKIDWALEVAARGGNLQASDIDVCGIQIADNQYQVRMWKIKIAVGIAYYYDVRLILQNRETYLAFIAPKDLHDVIRTWFISLCTQVEHECALEYKMAQKSGLIGRGWGQVNGKTWRTSCLDTAAGALNWRLIEKRNQETANTVTTAIVPVVKEKVNEFVDTHFAKIGTWSQSYRTSPVKGSDLAGQNAARRVRIHDEIKGGE